MYIFDDRLYDHIQIQRGRQLTSHIGDGRHLMCIALRLGMQLCRVDGCACIGGDRWKEAQ